jgi:hypothetical protein
MELNTFCAKFATLLQINMSLHSGHPDEYMELYKLIEDTSWEIKDDLVFHFAKG